MSRSKPIGIGIFYLAVFSVAAGCAHQAAEQLTPPAPAPAPVRPPSPKQEEVTPLLSMQVMAGNIEPLHGDDPTLPDQVMLASKGQVLEGSYKLCVAANGTVQSVTPVQGIDGADKCIMDALKAWRFPKLPLMVCKLQTLRFEIP